MRSNLEILVCPAADYFTSQGLPEQCVSAWCSLDYPLADRWGVELARGQTLAGGGTHCNFRFHKSQKK